jgi:hypothetical protein
MDEIDKLVLSIKRVSDGAKQAQIRFVECTSVDWENKTMTAKGTDDNVEYLDVVLGFGYVDIKPSPGSVCLIGIIDGQEVFTFLINAENAERVETKAGEIVYNGGKNAGLVKVKELTAKINALEKDLNSLKQIISMWVPVPRDGGASLKAAITQWCGQRITETKQAEIEDAKITH